jgi:hypothetical protein
LMHEHARLGAKNRKGQTVMEIAKEGKQRAILKLLNCG